MSDNKYDVIVIGAGHAGCEAALAAARMGAKTLIITVNMDHIAQMSCNPAIGGIAKGQVVREIDALGGAQGKITDVAAIQFRMLNIAKGPAVWSPRAQCDKVCFQRAMKLEMERYPGLDIKQAMVTAFIIDDRRKLITGVETDMGDSFYCASLVLANGTFLNGTLHYGMVNMPGGRAGDPPSTHLSEALREQLGLRIGRLKTGTPPRILAKTINFTAMQFQQSDIHEENFSYYPGETALPRAQQRDMPCYMVYSNDITAGTVRDNLHLSPMYQGKIKGIGTRYCPSFEDKVVRFPHHERHLLYLEPEGEFTDEYYINGISTSLPPPVQVKMIRSIPGMEKAEISRYAYAIEYDFIFPDQMERTTANKIWSNLFTAGQINGTSGYEEAAGQGLVAGMNAAITAAGKEPVALPRDLSYIGVMLDDLVTKEIVEPYRLFTSRAEYRLHLRQDNADLRLSEFAYNIGLLPENKYLEYCRYRDRINDRTAFFKAEKYQGKTLWSHLKQLKGDAAGLLPFPEEITAMDMSDRLERRAFRQLVIDSHYEGYLRREEESIAKLNKLECWKIPAAFNYDAVKGLKNESLMKLKKVLPATLAQAGRIDGITPAEIALLQVHLTRFRKQSNNETGPDA